MKEILNQTEYNEIIKSNKPVLLDFYADWCGPCQAMMPTVEKLANDHQEDFIIAKVNVDKNRDLAQAFGVRSIPALFFVKNGQVEERLVGMQSEASLNSKIREYAS